MKSMLGGALFALVVGFSLFVVASPDSCTRIERAAAPVRIGMDGIRWAGANWLSIDGRLSLLKASIDADNATQEFLAKQFYGSYNFCKKS